MQPHRQGTPGRRDATDCCCRRRRHDVTVPHRRRNPLATHRSLCPTGYRWRARTRLSTRHPPLHAIRPVSASHRNFYPSHSHYRFAYVALSHKWPSLAAVSLARVILASNSPDPVSRTQCTLITLLDFGMSFSDPRLESLLTLIHRHKFACSQISPFGPCSSTQYSCPAQFPSPHSRHANYRDGVPPTLKPIAARHRNFSERFFLLTNQTLLSTGRLALELHSGSVKSSASDGDDSDNAASLSKSLGFLRRYSSVQSSPTSLLWTQDPANVF